ncbi:MAG: TonB family protein [Terriglobales bacterium]
MSAAPSLALEKTPRRVFPRHPINVPLDLIALRFGVPENLPGRCTDISETGVGAVVAGELAAGQQVAVELRLPNVGVPVRARAVVRRQFRLHCGLEFVGLSVEQREMIRYWTYRSTTEPVNFKEPVDVEGAEEEDPGKNEEEDRAGTEADVVAAELPPATQRRIRIGRRRFYVLLASLFLLSAMGWWRWQRSWNELETHAQAAGPGLRVSESQVSPEITVSAETMNKRILTKIDPIYPEAARAAGIEGLVVLDAVIAADGSVHRLRPLFGADLLVQSAIEAVQSWKFEPYLSNGKAVPVETSITVEFRLH